MISLALILVPLVGALLIPIVRRRLPASVDEARLTKTYGLVVSGIVLVLALVALAAFDYGRPRALQLGVDLSAASGHHFRLGADGIALPLMVLIAMLVPVCLSRAELSVTPVLLLEAGALGAVVAADRLTFFVFFVLMLAGTAAALRAAAFLCYAIAGAVLVGCGLLATGSFGAPGGGAAAFALLALGFGCVLPLWPLHSWWPGTLGTVPTAGTILLAGVVARVAAFGLIRIAVPATGGGTTWFGALAVIQIVYGALACLAERDLRRFVSYAGIAQTGFLLFGVSSLSASGTNAALFCNVVLGLVLPLLLLVTGSMTARRGSPKRPAGYLTAALAFAALGGLGLAGMWGELAAMLGAFHPHPGLPRAAFGVFIAVAGIGAVLIVAFALRLMLLGTTSPVTPGDLFVWAPLILAIALLALWPATLLDLSTPVARALTGG
jgi:NADH-quinone oxidoreductase subunit M